ncbi:MAG: DNA polymerase III subunit beta [Synergistaceae bacterium]|jgi:DNA polymerase-3 subunit beta|nr:DNA polymerase III subunit beta [Synergistaceae bacterium]
MKINIVRSEFLRAWQMAERCSSTRSTVSSLAGVFLDANEDRVLLSATDLKTSIRCVAEGVSVARNGTAILPVKLLGELFKKVPADRFTIEVKDEKGALTAGRNRTRFSTWFADEFPRLPQSESAKHLCDVASPELLRILIEGSIASSPTDDFPKYLGACLIQLKDGVLRVISTDSRRLSLSRCLYEGGDGEADLLLPLVPLRELQRLLSSVGDVSVRILYDGSLAWFQMGQIEFSIRRVESTFPNYEKILNPNKTTMMLANRSELLSALDRIDIIVRSHTRLVVMHLSPGGQLKLTGKAPEFGTAVEELDATIDGEPLKAGFNVGFLQDGLKSLGSDDIKMNLNGDAGQMTLHRQDTDDFLYMLMPVRITEQDMIDPDEEDPFEDEPALERTQKEGLFAGAEAAVSAGEKALSPEGEVFPGEISPRKASSNENPEEDEALEALKTLERVSKEEG